MTQSTARSLCDNWATCLYCRRRMCPWNMG